MPMMSFMDHEEEEDVVIEDEDDDEEEEEDQDDDEEAELEELAFEMIKPRRRIGRPPKKWSSILLPKEVTSTLTSMGNKETQHGTITNRPRMDKRTRKGSRNNPNNKSPNCNDNDNIEDETARGTQVGQLVEGVVDGSFDAGFLVTLKMGNSQTLYRGIIFGPGLSIPVSRDIDIAKCVKRRRRRRLGDNMPTLSEEPSSITTTTTTTNTHPTTSSTMMKDDKPPKSNLEHHPQPSNDLNVRSSHEFRPRTSQPIDIHSHPLDPSPSLSLPNPTSYPYNPPFNPSPFRPMSQHRDINVNVSPFMQPTNFNSPTLVPFPSQAYNPPPKFVNGLPPNTALNQFGYTGGAQQVRPTTSLHSHYKGT